MPNLKTVGIFKKNYMQFCACGFWGTHRVKNYQWRINEGQLGHVPQGPEVQRDPLKFEMPKKKLRKCL